jgi:hypothetical protein
MNESIDCVDSDDDDADADDGSTIITLPVPSSMRVVVVVGSLIVILFILESMILYRKVCPPFRFVETMIMASLDSDDGGIIRGRIMLLPFLLLSRCCITASKVFVVGDGGDDDGCGCCNAYDIEIGMRV